MKRQHILLPAIVISLLLLQLTFAASPRYEVIDLGTLGGNFSCAYSINDNGQIVGVSYNGLGNMRATLFDPTGNGNNLDLGTLGGYDSSACSINNNGQVVGWADKSQYFMRATFFEPTGSGNNTDLGAWLGSPAYPSTSCAISINDAGQIVGWTRWRFGPYNETTTRAALFELSGGIPILLGTLGGSRLSSSSSINNSGQIVGSAVIRGWPSYSRALLFDPTGGGNNIDLGTLGGYGSVAYSINNNGQIVGSAGTSSGERHATQFDPTGTGQWHATQFVPPGTRQWHATLFDTSGNGNNIDLGTLGGDESYAISINERGQIVGWAYNSENDSRTILFDPSGNGNNIDLNTLIDPNSGWILEEARSINNHGWIVGKGYYIYNGVPPFSGPHAYLLIPQPIIIYVDADANGNNDGSSWTDAYNYLQDALSATYNGDEIRVAQGTYKPDQGAGITPGDRTATFQLINGVTLKGGYAGFGQPNSNARDIQLYETILSGNLNGDDVDVNDPLDSFDGPTRAENSYHVVTGSGTDSNTVLDGFIITGGNANGPDDASRRGGGMYNNSGSPTVTNCTLHGNSASATKLFHSSGGAGMWSSGNPTLANCTFRGNSASGTNRGTCTGGGVWSSGNPTLTNCTFTGNSAGSGGGMFNAAGNPILTKCTFSNNSAADGGGMCNKNSSPTVTNCAFTNNTVTHYGGGTCNFGGSPTIINCTFGYNLSQFGGGVFNKSSNSIIINCTFSGNLAEERGGAVYNLDSSPTLTNCAFVDNHSPVYGGGMFNNASNSTLTNCTFSGNLAELSGGGMFNTTSNPTLTNCTFSGNLAELSGGGMYNDNSSPTLTNCILWGDTPEEIYPHGHGYWPVITYSNVQGSLPGGEGNINADPCFVDLGYWDANGVWIDGNYHLLPGSPCIDAGDPNYVAEPNETDLDGKPRIIGSRIDMGAYEYLPPIPAEVDIDPDTLNLASKGKWISCYIWLPEEYNLADIDPNSILLEGEIEAESIRVDEQEQVAVAKFSRSEVQGILNVGDAELTITGQLTDGTVFEGTDIIRVLNKAGKN